jgi:putative sigma-54 modulation protein
MSLQITARNLDLTDDLREHVEKKVGKLSKFMDGTPDIHVILRAEKFRQAAEVTIMTNGITIHGQTETNDIFISLDKVVDKVQRQIVEDRRRTIAIKSRKNKETKGAFEAPAPPEMMEDNPGSEIVRGEFYSRKPMATEEALMQIKALGSDMFMYINSQTNEVNLLQKRKDGKYRLVEPEPK